MTFPNEILMIRPNGYRLAYSINPHMDLSNPVDSVLAFSQWENLKSTYEKLGFKVVVIEGKNEFPDMVFCANPIFWHPQGILLSQMKHVERQGEAELYTSTFGSLRIEKISTSFEGTGDLLWSFESGELFGGVGPRTEEISYDEIERILNKKITRLKLVNELFYHMDTCLSIINSKTAVFVPEAFDNIGQKVIRDHFSQLIEVNLDEGIQFLAANCHSPDGKNVLVESRAIELQQNLRAIGLKVHPINTSEFLKAGGSIFCMKHQGQFSL